ncbi:MAG TPA: YdeI/OmpD-associated family protein [Rubricoccaceae bacterium]
MTESFAAPVLRSETAMSYHYLPVPAEVAASLLASGTRRVVATMNGHTARRAIVTHEGAPAIIVGQGLLRDVGVREGETVFVDVIPDPEPDRVDLGDEFEAVLADDQKAADRFFGFTTGRQRSMASYVTGAKRTETRLRRALELAHRLRTHTLYGDLHGE